MFVIDIDATLLTSKGVMTEATYQTLLECTNGGVIICLATARSGRIVFKPDEIPWDPGFLLRRGIYYNGATVFDRPLSFFRHTPLPGDVVDVLVDHIAGVDETLQIALQHDNEYHSFKWTMSPAELQPWGFLERELIPFDVARRKPATKMMVYGGTDFLHIERKLPELAHSLMKAHGEKATVVLADSQRAIYIMSKHASKGIAASNLAELHGIEKRDVAVFGDDAPDLSMFGLFGHSIAMGNATDLLKANATHVTLTNDKDGVVYAIGKYLSL